jgi:hypothetical protein
VSDYIRIRVLKGHYRDSAWVPAGTLLELPRAQAQAMIFGNTAELAAELENKKQSLPLRGLKDVFSRLRPGARS